MIILKTVGILLTMIAGILTNITYIRQIKNKTEALRQTYLLIDYIEISVKYQNREMGEIFKNALLSNKFSLLFFLNDFVKNYVFSDYSEYDFNSVKSHRLFSDYACTLLKGYFSMVGKSDTDGQILNCETYKEFFKEELKNATENESSKIKTGSVLILGITIMILIILI